MYSTRHPNYGAATVRQTRDPLSVAHDARVVAATIRHLRLYGYVARWLDLEALYRPGMTMRELARAWLDRE
jgi:hypothetical protein